MDVRDFLIRFDEVNKMVDKSDRDELIKSIIKATYVPILKKRITAEKLLTPAVEVKHGINIIDDMTLHINTQNMKLFLYTNLNIDYGALDEFGIYAIYDDLTVRGIYDLIDEQLSEKEKEDFNMIVDNFVSNTNIRNHTAYQLNSLVEAITTAISKLTNVNVDELVNDIVSNTDESEQNTNNEDNNDPDIDMAINMGVDINDNIDNSDSIINGEVIES